MCTPSSWNPAELTVNDLLFLEYFLEKVLHCTACNAWPTNVPVNGPGYS